VASGHVPVLVGKLIAHQVERNLRG